jgi:spermidine/putrescine-binding protein
MKLANRSKALALALAVALTAVAGAGIVAAETLDDSTYSVTNDTQSVYAEVTGTSNISSASTADASVTYYGVNDDGVASEVSTSTVTVENGTTTLDEYTSINSSKYSEYRVVVDGNASKLDVETGTISKAAGGGSILGLDGSWTDSIPGDPLYLGAGLVAVVAVLAIVRD